MKLQDYVPEEAKNAHPLTLIYRYLGVNLALKVKDTGLTPNQVSVISFCLGALAAYLFSLASYWYLVLGALFYQLCIVLDYSDGALARLKGMTSNLGMWLEYIFDPVREFLVIFGICWGLYSQNANAIIWILGFILCGMNFLMDIQMMTFESFPFAGKETSDFAAGNRLYQLGRYFVSVRAIRYFTITGFAVANQMLLFLLLFSVYGILVFLVLAFGVGSIVKGHDKV